MVKPPLPRYVSLKEAAEKAKESLEGAGASVSLK